MNEKAYSEALVVLRGNLAKLKPGHPVYDEIIKSRDEVFAKYGPVFSSDHIPYLTKEEFTSFLYIENNRHWNGLHRTGLGAAADMDLMRKALSILLDESQPIYSRLPLVINMVKGLGKAIATGILTVAYPEKYGVWNNTSENALLNIGIWPNFERSNNLGKRYEKINSLFLKLSSDLGIDLWTLDALWWFLLNPEGLLPIPGLADAASSSRKKPIVPERLLEEYLLNNWEQTTLAKEWVVYSTDDNPEAGNQYPTGVGPIDILAKHKTEPRYLVIELKRDKSCDQTVGQALRYVGWIQKHLAQEGERVEALIIANQVDKKTQYAILTLPNFSMITYEVEFHLKEVKPIG